MTTTENKETWLSIASIWFGCIASLPALLIGSTLIASLTLYEAILVAILGYSFVLVFLSLLSVKSVTHRLNAVALAERSFGQTGSKILVGLIIGIASMVWFGVQTNIAGLAFSNMTQEFFNIPFSVPLSSFIWGCIMVLTAVFGFTYIKWLNYIAVPGIILLVIASLITTLEGVSFTDLITYTPKEKMPLLKSIGIVVGLIAVGGVIAPDYNRFAATPKAAVIGSIVGMLPAAVAFLTIGAILAIVKDTADIVAIFSEIGFPIAAMSVLILITWTSNVMSAYSGGLGLNSTFHFSEKNRPYTTLVFGIIGTLLGVVGILENFTDVAIILSAMIPPIAGVIIADYYLRKNKHEKTSQAFNWTGIVSWLTGVGVVFALSSDVKNILGIMISGCCYRILNCLLTKKTLIA